MKKIGLQEVIPIAILGAAGFLFYRIFIRKTVTEETTAAADQAVSQYIQQATSVQQPTKSRGEWALIADSIYNDLKRSRIDDNHGDAVYQTARVKNDADVATLIDVFGRRQEYFFGVPVGDEQSLPQFITSNLSSDEVALINNNYARKGIKFRF